MTQIKQEFIELTDGLKLAFRTVDGEKTEESIRSAKKEWDKCLKKANGDLEKAEKLYDQL